MSRLLIAMGFLFAFGLSAVPAHAGPPMPCIRATLSANGRILVVNDMTFDDPDETHARFIRGATLRVMSRYSEPNQGITMNGPNSYWAHEMWSVVFKNPDRGPVVGCPYTLVTDDGEFLVLVGDGFLGSDALSIYRRQNHPGQPIVVYGPDHGALVRKVQLSELWPSERIEHMITDATPQWFAGGTFAFSADNRTLVHKSRWGQTKSIDLATGKVTSQ